MLYTHTAHVTLHAINSAGMAANGGFAGVLAALRAHPADAAVQLAAAWAVCSFASSSAEHCAALGQAGACEAVVKLAAAAGTDAVRLYATVRALVALLGNSYNVTCLGAAGAGQATVAAMAAHAANKGLALEGAHTALSSFLYCPVSEVTCSVCARGV
jgi:hypothetical protein